MQEITVKKDALRSTLRTNRETHVKDFEIAWEAYHAKVVENVEQLLGAAKNARKGTAINLHVNLHAPVNHVEDYDRALEMLDWEVTDEVVLQEHEFAELVQDNWGWKATFSNLNTMYTGSASPSSR